MRDNGVVRALSGGVEAVRVSFMPPVDWTQFCSSNFRVPSEDNNLQVGFEAPLARGYYIDNIRLIRQPCGAIEDGCPLNLTCVDNQCICVPDPNPCQAYSCGSVDNGCGTPVSCGVCADGSHCHNHVCIPDLCCPDRCERGSVCDPDTCQCIFPI